MNREASKSHWKENEAAMAPVRLTSLGVTPQSVDDAALVSLNQALRNISVKDENGSLLSSGLESFLNILRQNLNWAFEEQVRMGCSTVLLVLLTHNTV